MLRFLYTDNVLPPLGNSCSVRVSHCLGLYELSNKYDIPSLAQFTAKLIHGFIERSSTGTCDILCIRVARMLYCDLSHDGHSLRKKFLERLSKDRDPRLDLMEFARENLEFAGETHG